MIMEYVIACLVGLSVLSYMLGRGSADGKVLTLKRENEVINAKLKELTNRDERGRFVRNKDK